MPKIIVLGAGASVGAKKTGQEGHFTDRPIPGAKKFFNDVSHIPEREAPFDYLNFFGLTYEHPHELISQAWQIKNKYFDPKEWENVDIEELLTFLDIGTKLYTKGSNYQWAFQETKRAVEDFIVFITPAIKIAP
ncbi:MAG: hypothetical protein GY834_00455 [Bacteroidetes bacterium]|nr:hypothetical protein [Bacteroidota bacterium]